MAAEVLFWRLPEAPAGGLVPADPRPGLRSLVAAAGLAGAARPGSAWMLRAPVGPPGRPASVPAEWALAVAGALAGSGGAEGPPPGIIAFDTTSIATRGLDTAASLRTLAGSRGHGPPAGLPFAVADDPDGPEPWPLAGGPPGHALAGALRAATGLVLLTPVRPHPHLGASGSVAALGLDLADRKSRLALHSGIRPQVDTPLCAGCGSCLDVCLYDAIVIRGGRAVIDHRHCTGCGECMGVCFMAGIAPEAAAGVAAFQGTVAGAAVATARQVGGSPPHKPLLYVNLLVHLDFPGAASRARRRLPLAGIGVLASADPVALDSAAIDLLADRLGGPLSQWSGFPQVPAPLLDRAAALGLGSRQYTLREV